MRSTEDWLAELAALARQEHWLATLVTTRPDGEPGVSLVNAGVLAHPVTGAPALAFVARGATAKLRNLRHHPRATLMFRAGWEWVAARGPVQLAGPDDTLPGLPAGALPGLLRDIYHAAGGSHADLDEYDREMAADRRTAALLSNPRFFANPPGTDHEEHP